MPVNSKLFNGRFVTDYLNAHPQLWKALTKTLWSGKTQQNKTYFLDKTDVKATTLWMLHEVTGLPLDMFFIGEGEEQPDVHVADSRIDIHHNHIETLNANSNPEVLLAYLQMSRDLLTEKDKRIAELQSSVESLKHSLNDVLNRLPVVNNSTAHPDLL